MRRDTPARVARAEAKVELARLLTRLLYEHDIEQLAIAQACGVDPSIVQRWCSRDRLETPSVADVLAMPRPIALGLLAWQAEAHHHVVAEAPETVSVAEDLAHLAATITECGEAATVTARALLDGAVSPAEAREIDRETTEAMAHLAGLRERARGVLSLRGAGR